MVYGQYIVTSARGSQFAGEGIKRKVYDQIALLKRDSISCKLTVVYRESQDLRAKILEHYFPGAADSTAWDISLIDQGSQFLYIRKPFYFSSDFISFLKKCKTKNPALVIYLEIPTYPYEREYSFKQLPMLIKDLWNRRKLYKYVDYIVDLFGNKTLFGIPTIEIKNGIPVTDSSKRIPIKLGNQIRMICSASFSPWHGIDRLIKGMAKYYQHGGVRNICLTLVGSGDEIKKYKRLTKSLDLVDKVMFFDQVPRDELRSFYNSCNLGVESLARHRTGSKTPNSSLKSRDYLNAGLPFFGEGKVDVLTGTDFPYYLEISQSELPIDMNDVIDFFDSIYKDKDETAIIDNIHDFAKRNDDLNMTFSGVIKAIEHEVEDRSD